jgi:hypothetical protein
MNGRSTDQIRMFLQKRSHPLTAQTFLEVYLDKTENVSLGNVVPCAVAFLNESYDCRCLIFIECESLAKPPQKRKNGTTVTKAAKWGRQSQKRGMESRPRKLKSEQNYLKK